MNILNISKLPKIPASHEDPDNPGVWKKIIFTYHDLLADSHIQMINMAILPPNKSFRSHMHEDLEEIFIMVKGWVIMNIDGNKAILHKDDAILIPPGAVHKMENISKTEANYIVIGVTKEGKGKTLVL
jgi:mannose-6-phosphate isomerase-like protein (cupin superfamily)